MEQSCPLEAQPPEILEQILEYVDRSDLLALSLASPSVVASVVIPRHLPGCCLDIQNISLLQKLSISPLRFRISSLEFVSERDSARIHIYGDSALSLPDTQVVEIPESKEMPFSDPAVDRLLREMKNLRSFHWNVAGIQPSEGVFTALQSATSILESFRVHSFRLYGHNDVPDNWFLRDSPLWRFSNLTTFSFAVSSLTSFYHTTEYIKQLVGMLQRCPMLQDLELMLAHDRPSNLDAIFQGRWPHLKRFFLGGCGTRSSSAAVLFSSKIDVQSFFEQYPNIEVLYLNISREDANVAPYYVSPADANNLSAYSFGIESLPSLQNLYVAVNVFTMVSPVAIIPRLKHLRKVEIAPMYLPLFRQLSLGFPQLTSIWMFLNPTITIPAIKSFFACVPQVEKLHMDGGVPEPWVPIVRMPHQFYHEIEPLATGLSRGATTAGPFGVVTDDPLGAVLDTLSVLPRLTHLSNFVVFHARENFDDLADPIVRQLAANLPQLKYLEISVSTGHDDTAVPSERGLRTDWTWIEISRDGSGDFTGWNAADPETENLHYHSWGALEWCVGI
ncbi:hypothetical protein C8R44DRAFT_347823 [Mycena epipterygia]|nr:hypothetical protein C8R44DRAFT_347823 [Mycena epipterygia]